MNSSSNGDSVRRCRPLLGTFVEITAHGRTEEQVRTAVEKAFAAIARVQSLMSVHDTASALSRLNQMAATKAVPVERDLFTVLERGLALAAESGGAFDLTVAPTLARWGLRDRRLRRSRAGDWRDVELLPRRRVRFARPVALDLGGIAKGFAVDQAIAVLRAAGLPAATVNAGGDLRVFGPRASVIHLRDPRVPQALGHRLELRDAALATSSPCFTERRWRGQTVSHLVNPLSGRATLGAVSVTVRARECWLADALTKVVLHAPDRAQEILARHEAAACFIHA